MTNKRFGPLAHKIATALEAAGQPRPNGDILHDVLDEFSSNDLGVFYRVKKLVWHNGARNIWYAAGVSYCIVRNPGDPDLYIVKTNLPGVTTNPWTTMAEAQEYVQRMHEEYILSTLE